MATPVPVVVKGPSWLSKFGTAVKNFLVGSSKALPTVQKIVDNVAVPLAETFLPQFAPEIAAADSWFDKGVGLILLNESTFAAVQQANNGPAKFQAVLTGISSDFDAWVVGNFPGGAELVKAEEYIAAKNAYLQQYINSTVGFLNQFTSVTPLPTASAVAAASAAVAAVQASQSTAQAMNKPVAGK